MLKQCLAIVAHDSGQATTLVRATAHSVATDLSSPLPSLRWPAVESPQLTSAQPETPGADRFASKATATRCQTQPATICGCPRRTAASGRPIPNDATARAPRHRRLSCLAHALKELTGDQQRLDPWRKQRYAFAHRGGTFLIEAHPPTPVALGPALYSVYLVGTGLWYVGLPIGESHHLAVSVPPELWTRVIVFQCTELLAPAGVTMTGLKITT
jgi:hypothetical protein